MDKRIDVLANWFWRKWIFCSWKEIRSIFIWMHSNQSAVEWHASNFYSSRLDFDFIPECIYFQHCICRIVGWFVRPFQMLFRSRFFHRWVELRGIDLRQLKFEIHTHKKSTTLRPHSPQDWTTLHCSRTCRRYSTLAAEQPVPFLYGVRKFDSTKAAVWLFTFL